MILSAVSRVLSYSCFPSDPTYSVGALLAAAATPLLLGLVWGGQVRRSHTLVAWDSILTTSETQTSPWHSVQTLVPLLTGIAFSIVFAIHQIYLKSDGLFSHAMFKNIRNVAVAIIGTVRVLFSFKPPLRLSQRGKLSGLGCSRIFDGIRESKALLQRFFQCK